MSRRSRRSDHVYGVVVGALLVAVGAVGSVVVDPLGPYADPVIGLLLVGWVVLPVSTYLDLKYVAEQGEWEPYGELWVAACLVLFLNVAVAGYYLYRRKQAVGFP